MSKEEILKEFEEKFVQPYKHYGNWNKQIEDYYGKMSEMPEDVRIGFFETSEILRMIEKQRQFLSKSLDTMRDETLEEVKRLYVFSNKYGDDSINKGIRMVYGAIEDIDKPVMAKEDKPKETKE